MKYAKDHTVYINKDNKEVPSATTIIKILNKPAISRWANYLGFKHLHIDDVLNDYARLGTQIHEMISEYLLNRMYIYVPDGDINLTDLFLSLKSFMDWYKSNDIELIFSEKKFTSDKFGGTVDFYGKVNGKYTIIDFKTSKKIRITMFIQLALYTILLEENDYKVEQVGIVLCNKQHKDTKIISREDFGEYIELAKVLIDLFHIYFNLNEKDKWGESII